MYSSYGSVRLICALAHEASLSSKTMPKAHSAKFVFQLVSAMIATFYGLYGMESGPENDGISVWPVAVLSSTAVPSPVVSPAASYASNL